MLGFAVGCVSNTWRTSADWPWLFSAVRCRAQKGLSHMTPTDYFVEARQEAAELLEAVGDNDKLLAQVMTIRRVRLYLSALVALTEPVKKAA
jgi:hypothetical protein